MSCWMLWAARWATVVISRGKTDRSVGGGRDAGAGRGQEMANLSSHCTMKCSNWSGYRLSGGQPAYRHTWPRENPGHLSS